jgi:hypothetical protein
LAEAVAPPSAPTEPSPVLDTAGAAGPLGCLLFFCVFALVILGGIALNWLTQPNASSAFLILLVAITSLSLGSWAYRWATRSVTSSARSLKQQEEAEYRIELAAYKKALAIFNDEMAKWHRSYFCHRCGNIFEPQSS